MNLYFWALGLTVIIELILVTLASRAFGRTTPFVEVLLLNLFTHPLATMAILQFGLPFWPVELGVMLLEATGYRWLSKHSWAQAFALSLIANGATSLASFLF